MQTKTLGLLFSAAALAIPGADAYSYSVPSSIEAVLQTAIPSAWAASFATDQEFQLSVLSEWALGTKPAWFSTLPSSVQAYYTSELAKADSSLPTGAATATAVSGSSPTVTGTSTSASGTTFGLSRASGVSTTGVASTSTGGASLPTGAVGMGIAGAAGLLSLAIIL